MNVSCSCCRPDTEVSVDICKKWKAFYFSFSVYNLRVFRNLASHWKALLKINMYSKVGCLGEKIES